MQNYSELNKKILCFGEISWDQSFLLRDISQGLQTENVISKTAMPGGCALNSACILGGLSAPVVLGGNYIGRDQIGQELKAYLSRAGVENYLSFARELTPVCQCLVDSRNGNREFVLFHERIQDYGYDLIEPFRKDLSVNVFSHIFIQPYLQDACRNLLPLIPKESWIMSQDLAPESEFIESIDCLQLSLDENQVVTADSISIQSKSYFRGRLSTIIFTQGRVGIWISEKSQEPVFIQACKIDSIIDTTGCGDAFRAGFIWGLFCGKSLYSAIEVGQIFGAYKARFRGSHFIQGFEKISN